MANKKSYKKKVENATKIEEVTKPEIIEDEVSSEEVQPVVEEVKLQIARYEVVLATPTYFVVNKKGTNVTIKRINNYKKGDMVTI